jgi:ankyrin repeat protein
VGFNSACSNLLSKVGADLYARIADECTSLHLAARYNTYVAVTKMLLDLKSAINSREVNEWTLLHLAAQRKS